MKSTTIYFFVIILFLAAPAFSQKEARTVPQFHSISFGIPGVLYLKQGDVQSLQLEGDKDDLNDIETEVVNGQLRIKVEDHRWFDWKFRNDVNVYITVPKIDEVSLGGSGKVVGDTRIQSDDLRLSVSGSGNMELDVVSDGLKLDVSGSGKMDLKVNASSVDQHISGSGGITLSGNAKSADLDISGSGRLDASGLDVGSYHISISGSGKCDISVRDAIEASISGSGSVYYKGSPDRVISKVSGSGKVRKMD
jgi:hypothetical protein